MNAALEYAQAMATSAKVIRQAQNKPSPSDFAVGTREWEACMLDFARDLRALMDALNPIEALQT